jgi:hypothetical protein
MRATDRDLDLSHLPRHLSEGDEEIRNKHQSEYLIFRTRSKDVTSLKQAFRNNISSSGYSTHTLNARHRYGIITDSMVIIRTHRKGTHLNNGKMQMNDKSTDTHNQIFKALQITKHELPPRYQHRQFHEKPYLHSEQWPTTKQRASAPERTNVSKTATHRNKKIKPARSQHQISRNRINFKTKYISNSNITCHILHKSEPVRGCRTLPTPTLPTASSSYLENQLVHLKVVNMAGTCSIGNKEKNRSEHNSTLKVDRVLLKSKRRGGNHSTEILCYSLTLKNLPVLLACGFAINQMSET